MKVAMKGEIWAKSIPIAWSHDYDGGRAVYTGLGHTDESYEEPAFLQHLLGAINICHWPEYTGL